MDSLQLECFLEFTERYNRIANSLPVDKRVEPEYTMIPGDQVPIMQYLNLCSEEFTLADHHMIPDAVMNHWIHSMNCFTSNATFQEFWGKIKGQFEKYEDFCSFVDSKGGIDTVQKALPNRNSNPQLSANQLRVFIAYTKRFEEIAINLIDATRVDPGAGELDREVAVNYLNLCSEQFYIYSLTGEFIPENIWSHWKSNMETFLANPGFSMPWDLMSRQYQSNKAFHDFAEQTIPKIT